MDSNFLLGCFKIDKEDYNEIKNSLKEILDMIRNLKNITFENKTYKIEYFLGGDLKFLALALGINASNGDYPCIWCKSLKSSFATNIHNHEADRVISGNIFAIINDLLFDF